MSERPLLERFQNAILSKDAVLASPDVKPAGKITPRERLAIYIDGYRLRLMEALRADYPEYAALAQEAFTHHAHAFIETHPSTKYNLDHYPFAFADFLESHERDRFRLEVAMVENAVAEVFSGAESLPFTPVEAAELTPDAFGGLILKPRLASRLLTLEYPVSAWLDERRSGKNPPRPTQEASHLYIFRHENEVKRETLGEPVYQFLKASFQDKTIAQAMEETALQHPEWQETLLGNIAAWFGDWLRKGFFRIDS